MICNIKKLRLIQGMTQFELAVESGVSLPTIQNIEAGKANPSIELLTKIFTALGFELKIIPKDLDIKKAIHLGVPLLSKTKISPFNPSKEELKKECRNWINHLTNSSLGLRESMALVSLFMALKDHWPSFYDEINSIFLDDLIEKNRKNGQCIKLRRIAITNLSKYI